MLFQFALERRTRREAADSAAARQGEATQLSFLMRIGIRHQQAQVVDTEPDWDVALCNGWPTPGRGSAVSMGSEALGLLAQVAAVAAAEIGVWLDRLLGQLTNRPD